MSFFERVRQQKLQQIQEEEAYGQNIQGGFAASVQSPPWSKGGFPIRFNMGLGLQQSSSDPSLLWSLTPPLPFYSNSDMGLSFGKQTIVLTGLANLNSLANYLYIAIDGFQGMFNINGVATNNVVKYGLSSINYVPTTPATYTAIYKSQPIDWILPYNMTTLNFRLYLDDNGSAQTTPLGWQFGFEFSITRTPFDRRFQQQNEYVVLEKMIDFKSLMF